MMCLNHSVISGKCTGCTAYKAQVARLEAAKWMERPDEDGEGGITWAMAFADHDMLLKEEKRLRGEAQDAYKVLALLNEQVAAEAEKAGLGHLPTPVAVEQLRERAEATEALLSMAAEAVGTLAAAYHRHVCNVNSAY